LTKVKLNLSKVNPKLNRSLQLHPDKNPSPEAAELQQIVTAVHSILKREDMRERCDGLI
jgi:curved DNA-binding protein CbpA